MFDRKMAVPIICVMIVMVRVVHAEDIRSTPRGVEFLGIGYNIIEGNPEGGDLINGGVDPGLLLSRRVLDLHYDNGKTSSGGQYLIPDEVYFLHRQSAYASSTYTTFYGTSSYQSKLSSQVSVSASISSLFAEAQFAASERYRRIASRISSHGSVFIATEEVKNIGHARYLTELARPERHRLNAGFVANSCKLPGSYDEAAYMKFLDTWGTHVVTEVDLGTREGEIYEEDRSFFFKNALKHADGGVKVSGSVLKIAQGPFAFNMDSFNFDMANGTSFGSTYSKYKVGSETLHEPISVTITGMHEIFDEDFWTRLPEYVDTGYCKKSWNRTDTWNNVLKAMKGYATWKQISASHDPDITARLTWPEGTYGLPKPISGCPNTEFTWNEGFRMQNTEDQDGKNEWSSRLNLAGARDSNYIAHHFCMKTVSIVDTNSHWIWQPGSYCIYKYHECPPGFQEGWIFWDDEDDNPYNLYGGRMPYGIYDQNTKMYFCCRNDGVIDKAIYLPTDDNFFLFSLYEHCQKVHGMKSENQWLLWDNDSGTGGSQSDVHPYLGVLLFTRDVHLQFCYYQPLEETTPED